MHNKTFLDKDNETKKKGDGSDGVLGSCNCLDKQ